MSGVLGRDGPCVGYPWKEPDDDDAPLDGVDLPLECPDDGGLGSNSSCTCTGGSMCWKNS